MLAPGLRRIHPGLRLVVDRGRLVERSRGANALALAARVAGLRAYAVWPSAHLPQLVLDLSAPEAADWAWDTFVGERRRPRAATWAVLRAGGVVVGPMSSLVREATERALGRPLNDPHLVAHSPTGSPFSKATVFLFEGRAYEPAAVVKAMPEPSERSRLRAETDIVEALRERLDGRPDVIDALPLPPLLAEDLRGEYVVVQAVDPRARATGRNGADGPARAWLRAFQEGTSERWLAWDEWHDQRLLRAVRHAWGRARPDRADAVAAAVERLTRPLAGTDVPDCARHGDFWRGNIAFDGHGLRVYDWEWATHAGGPFFDLWTYELGELRERAEDGESGFGTELERAVERVAAELDARGIDGRFARATLAPALGYLTFRVRWSTGRRGGGEEASVALMADAEPLLV
jgi:hypothetical protein